MRCRMTASLRATATAGISSHGPRGDEPDAMDTVLIKAADVLHNVHALLADLGATDDPEPIWRPFNAGPERQLWYFTSVVEKVEHRLGDNLLARELRTAVERLRPFVPE